MFLGSHTPIPNYYSYFFLIWAVVAGSEVGHFLIHSQPLSLRQQAETLKTPPDASPAPGACCYHGLRVSVSVWIEGIKSLNSDVLGSCGFIIPWLFAY